MAVLTYSSSLQDRIAYRLWNNSYTNLAANQKADMDGASAANPPVLGKSREAYLIVNALGQWVQQIDKTAATAATTVDDAAEMWFVDETAYRLALTHRPERIPEMRQLRDESRDSYYDTFSTLIATGYTADVYTITPQSIRFYCLRRIIQLIRGGKSVFPSPEEIDGVAFDVLSFFWNFRDWNFRRRRITIDFVTTSNGASPTINTASGELFDSMATQVLMWTGSNYPNHCRWAEADTMAALKANTSASTGLPEWFRIERNTDTFSWILHPYPSAACTASAEVFIKMPGTTTPGVPTSATDTVPYAKLPTEFRALFKELVLGKLLKNRGIADTTWKDAMDQLERYAQTYDDHGEVDRDGSQRDVYCDAAMLPNAQWLTGFGSPGDVGGTM